MARRVGSGAERERAEAQAEGDEIESYTLAPRTIQEYRGNLERHVIKSMGHFKVREVTPGAIKTMLRNKREAGLGKNSVRLIRAALSVVLSDAVEDGLLLVNPAIFKGGRRKKRGTLTQRDRVQSIKPMSFEQRDRFLDAAHEVDAMHGVLFAVMAKTGLRPGEALAPKLEDLNLGDRKLRVERAVSLGKIKSTKTGGAPDVDLSAEVVGLLEL